MMNKAPLFNLNNQEWKTIKLSNFIGKKNIILSFHPLAWTSVCAQQMKDLDSKFQLLQKYDTIGLGISVDSPPCKKAWAKSLKLKHINLLSDFWPHGKVADCYGILNKKEGFSNRSVFIINKQGKITWKKLYPPAQLPDINEIIREIQKI